MLRNKLGNELKQIQNRRKFLYKVSSQYLEKMFYGELTYIDYLNMEELKRDIKKLDKKGQKVVKRIVITNNGLYDKEDIMKKI